MVLPPRFAFWVKASLCPDSRDMLLGQDCYPRVSFLHDIRYCSYPNLPRRGVEDVKTFVKSRY